MAKDELSLLRGGREAVARALNTVEDVRPEAQARARALLAELQKSGAVDRAHRIGVTGPPGVGKSTLLAVLARALRTGKAGTPPRTVGILAVDPSSVRSGGALLGDRARIAPDPSDEGVFVRSLSTAGELGGLARSVPASVLVLGAAFDIVLVETVGVGQSETDVRHVVDTVVFVVQPGSGDSLQYMKAGVMEVPDLVVVNKADEVELATRTRAELASALASLRAAGVVGADIPLLSTSARDGTGIDELVDALEAHRTELTRGGQLAARRRAGSIAWGMRAFLRRYGEVGVEQAGGEQALESAIAARIDEGDEVLGIVESLGGG
jgi:LAO/AO transport system kinase